MGERLGNGCVAIAMQPLEIQAHEAVRERGEIPLARIESRE